MGETMSSKVAWKRTARRESGIPLGRGGFAACSEMDLAEELPKLINGATLGWVECAGDDVSRKCWCGNDDTIRTSRFEVLVENLAGREQRRPLYLAQAARPNFVDLKHRVVPNPLNLRAMVNELLTT